MRQTHLSQRLAIQSAGTKRQACRTTWSNLQYERCCAIHPCCRSRAYFKDGADEAAAASKPLRCLVRFAVVCLLLDRREVRLYISVN